MHTKLRKRSQQGAESVEFALVFGLFFLILLFLIQVGLFMFQRMLLFDAAAQGASKLAAMRGYDYPYTGSAYSPARKGVNDQIRQLLNGNLAPAAALDSTLTITMQVRTPYTSAADCTAGCTCSGASCASDSTCVMRCSSNATCICALGTSDDPPPPGTTARVALSYNFVPFLKNFGFSTAIALNATGAAPVQ
jgi:Flp pilus assembly protein TadG